MGFRMRRTDLDHLPPVEVPPGYNLRTYRPGDEVAWCAMMEGQIGHGWTTDRFFREVRDQPVFRPDGLYFAEWEGEPVSTACAWWLPDRFGTETGVLHMVATHPAHRGRGLARAVSLAVLHFFRQVGVQRCILHTDENRLYAVRLYLALGFRPDLDSPAASASWGRALEHLGLDLCRFYQLEVPVAGEAADQ